jgi:hypothetical protein
MHAPVERTLSYLMRTAKLIRNDKSDVGTFGVLITDSGFECFTGELPWRDNETARSCIPPGTYKCIWRESPRHGLCYHVEGVPGREAIEIHSANWCGDLMKGYRCQLEGCIAPGTDVGDLNGQKAVKNSVQALKSLVEDLDREPFQLTIEDQNDLPPYDVS